MERLTADIIALADVIRAERMHVIGHDWGGAVAWALSAQHPHRLLTMTSLATPHGRALMRSMTSSDQAWRSSYVALFQLPWLPELLVGGPGSRQFRDALIRSGLNADDARQYVQRLREPGVATAALNWYRALPFTSGTDLGPSKVPTLYVYGTADVALGRQAAERTADHVDAPYRYEPLERESHWLPEQAPATVARMFVEHAQQFPNGMPGTVGG